MQLMLMVFVKIFKYILAKFLDLCNDVPVLVFVHPLLNKVHNPAQ